MTRAILVPAVGLAACVVSAAEVSKDWKIVAPPQATPVVKYAYDRAAELLKRDLAEGAGLDLEIVKEVPASGHAIVLGADAAKAAGLDVAGLKWYDNAIVEKDGRLYLFGNDRARSKDQKHWDWDKAALPTFGAATRFLHDFLGNRYCAPGETGRHVGRREKVVVPDGTRSVERPTQMFGGACRSDIVYSYGAGYRGMGLFHTYGGHTYPVAVPTAKYAKTHPEYYSLSPEGRRIWGPTDGQTALCISNPEVEDLIVNELLKRYDGGAEVCQLAQQDGSNHCWCEKCMAMYGTDDWCEKTWLYHKHIAERIEKLRPGKIVHILSYDITKTPPKTFTKFPSNVMIELCSYSEETFAEWKRYDVPHGFTVYVYFWGNYPQPGFVARHSFAFLADHARRFRRNNVKGIFRCGYGDLYGLEGPGYYVFNELMADPERPVDEIVAEYCKSMFGPAAGLMQQFYDTQDARLRGLDRLQQNYLPTCGNGLKRYLRTTSPNNGDLHAWALSPDTVKALEDFLSRAEATEGLADKEKRRLDLVRREFDYAKTMGEIAYLYGAYKFRPTPASFDALAEAILARREAMLGLSDGKDGGIKLPGWPELSPLNGGGYYGGTYWLKWNGRLSATMGAPLNWDVKLMKAKGILPGVTMAEKSVARADAAPTLDGLVAGTGVWAKATETKLNGVQGEVDLPETTTFRLAYDEKNLYVGVKTDLPAGTKIPEFDADGNVWSTECLDLFVAASKTADVNYHLIWSPAADSRLDYAFGLITEPLDPNYNLPDIRWNGKWSHADRRVGDVWYSLLAIPYADLGAATPKTGEAWRFNLGRCTNPTNAKGGERLYLWSPNLDKRSLDNADAMGRIRFE